MEEELNISSDINDETNYSDLSLTFPSDVSDIIENYVNFVKANVTTSVTPVKVNDQVAGVVRANKRIIMEIDKSFSEMNNELIKTEEVNSEPINIDELWDIKTDEKIIENRENLNINC